MNYTELVEAAKQYSDRQDIEVTSNFGIFFKMVEAKINRLLKTREQSMRLFTPTVSVYEYYPLPADFAGMRSIQLNNDLPSNAHKSKPLEYVTPEVMSIKRNSLETSVKVFYTIVSNQIQIAPKQAAGQTLEISYYQKVPAITETEPENWLSISHPDIYLSGLIAEIEIFAKNYEVGKSWYDRMALAIDELENTSDQETWTGAPLVMRVE
jgi:hypothetical protein